MANNENETCCNIFDSQKKMCWALSIAAGGLLLGILLGKSRKKKKRSSD